MENPSEKKSGCPVDHSGFIKTTSTSTPTDALRPENQMPILSQTPGEGQQIILPTARALSTIPKSSDSTMWEYPSSQQFYNALLKKGWATPEEEVETMVDIHNWMNEGSWYTHFFRFYQRQEILRWEKKHHCGCETPKLKKFQGSYKPSLVIQGRPNDLSPKAWFLTKSGISPKPFDRHDWTIDRCGKEVRYVIDYYSGEEKLANPEFFIDVRPAMDSPGAFVDRTREFCGEMWAKYF